MSACDPSTVKRCTHDQTSAWDALCGGSQGVHDASVRIRRFARRPLAGARSAPPAGHLVNSSGNVFLKI